jgi:hypothetical protein
MMHLAIEQLASDPELAVLAVLDAAAGAAVLTLAAVYPELKDTPDPDDVSAASTREALSVIERARALGVALARYRCVLLRERLRNELLHF